ncbi:MAG TPA: carboxypeptidase-like regulatory domain-containing protein [Caulifigura sp.]|nr:carboxypeptidase-like regulatory domain-containing protein [Caulifigura sp.]
MQLSRTSISRILVIAAAACLPGCDNGPLVSSVKGTVTLDGKPLANATVVFSPEAGGRSSLGRTNDTGEYKLLFSGEKDGALVGSMRVRITVAEEYTDSRDRSRMRPELVPAKYNENSELVVEVEPKDNVIDFDLKTK